jgi:hypothetical protein
MMKFNCVTVIVALLLGAATGFLIGRAFPAHQYAVAGANGFMLLDTTTGRICFANKIGKATSEIPPCQSDQ